ncbi:Transcriptional regulator of heat shock response [Pseudomonas syringae pv. actinidiae]|uniref:Transcriptional regulator of heat shock response n=1 Tax=Pseudomonas syringae pv. actinidiae TaxID=103796 RepID=A0A2V0Q334_PSESF|nr:Transcriptional regulator of heat shock response [Pseudomonas syringae pv. actinidiae]
MGQTFDLLTNLRALLCLCLAQIVGKLQVKPELRTRLQAYSQTQRYISAHTSALEHDVVHRRRRNLKGSGQRCGGQPHRLKIFLFQNLAWMDGAHSVFVHWSTSVIIDNFYILGTVDAPNEANPELSVYTYAVLARTTSIKHL